MTALALLVPVALGLGLLALFFFGWTLRNGQYEDPEGAAARILFEDNQEVLKCPPSDSR